MILNKYLEKPQSADRYQTVYIFHIRDIAKEDEIYASLVSDRCQFCGATFNGANQLSLHYKEKRSEEMGQNGDSCKKNDRICLKNWRTYEIKRTVTRSTASYNQDANDWKDAMREGALTSACN